MSYRENPYGGQYSMGPGISPGVKFFLIANGSIFLIQQLFRFSHSNVFISMFALTPSSVSAGFVWQLLTYSFLHANFMHLLFNMLTLWMFGVELENYWGSKRFVKFFLFTSFTGGLFSYIIHYTIFPQGTIVGASGGLFGLLIAYAILWPNREVLFMLLFPIKIKYMVLIMMLMMVFMQQDQNIAHMAHLGGVLGALFYLFILAKYSVGFNWSFADYRRRRNMERWQKEMNEKNQAKEKVDDLLDKISRNGMKSLSRAEQKFLKKASKNYYSE